MFKKIKEKLYRTRHLVKLAREDLETVKRKLVAMEENACSADGPMAWSPSAFHNWERILGCLRIRSLGVDEKARVGGDADGGYVLPADWRKVSLLISLGIGPDNSFDAAFAEAGIPVEAYDPTISKLPLVHPKIHWIKKMVVANPGFHDNEISLEQILERISHHPMPALKMDIEGWEYPVILTCPQEALGKLRFFVAEFHEIADAVASGQTATLEAVWSRLSDIFDTVHLHGNNTCGVRVLGGALVPNLLEITMVNRNFYHTVPWQESFPGSLDCPNFKGRADIQMCLPVTLAK